MIGEAKTMLGSLKDKRIQHLLTEIYNDEVKLNGEFTIDRTEWGNTTATAIIGTEVGIRK